MAIGTVKFFNLAKGFGFIMPEDGGKDIFVHKAAVEMAGLPPLKMGQLLLFETEQDAKGAMQACKLQPRSEVTSPARPIGSIQTSASEGKPPQRASSRYMHRIQIGAAAAMPRQLDTTGLQARSKSPDDIREWQRSYSRYCDRARQSYDDVVERERYWQYAEHFLRMINGSAD